MNSEQLNILFGLLFSGWLLLVYYSGVFKYLFGSFKRALVLYKFAFHPRGNFYLICRQFKAIPEITGHTDFNTMCPGAIAPVKELL